MKILWVCNLILPEIAQQIGLPSIPKEGWVKGLLDAMLEGLINKKPEIMLAFPLSDRTMVGDKGYVSGVAKLAEHENREIAYFGFYEDTVHESVYDETLEERIRALLAVAKPDIVHCFGTEFPHTLAFAKVWNNPDKLLIGLQGICVEYAGRYTSHLPEKIVNRHTFRDFIKRDSIRQQQEKYVKRGIHEKEALALAGHIAGRTEFDRNFAHMCNPEAEYHHAGETLRRIFYEGEWKREESEKYRIFVSQADYPLKGFHYLLEAAGILLADKDFEGDLQIYVAGQSVMNRDGIKAKIKAPSYGRYLLELVDKYSLSKRLHILGRLSAEEMKQQYLKCGIYVCCSECENSPNSLGEAMMLQVPIVTSEVGGITSVFSKGKDGYSYPDEPEDSFQEISTRLAESMKKCWENQNGETDARRKNAGIHARQNHDPEHNAEEMLGIYGKIYSCR